MTVLLRYLGIVNGLGIADSCGSAAHQCGKAALYRRRSFEFPRLCLRDFVRGIAPAEANQHFGKAQPYRTGGRRSRRMLLVAIEVIN